MGGSYRDIKSGELGKQEIVLRNGSSLNRWAVSVAICDPRLMAPLRNPSAPEEPQGISKVHTEYSSRQKEYSTRPLTFRG